MNCPLCDTPVSDTDITCPGCEEMLSEWRVINGNSRLLRQRGLILAHQQDLVGACLAFVQAALSDPTDNTSLVDAGRSLLLLERHEDAARILDYAHQRSRESGARALLGLMKQRADEAQQAAAKKADAETAEAGSSDSPSPESNEQQGQVSTNGAPMLALDLLVRKKSFFGGGETDRIWKAVVHCERNWQDWQGLQGWLKTLCAVPEPHPALIYLRGLDAWQRDDSRSALRLFADASDREASVLNPSVWMLYASLMTGHDDAAGIKQVGAKDFAAVRDVLSRRLKGIDTDQSREALRRLRNLPA